MKLWNETQRDDTTALFGCRQILSRTWIQKKKNVLSDMFALLCQAQKDRPSLANLG